MASKTKAEIWESPLKSKNDQTLAKLKSNSLFNFSPEKLYPGLSTINANNDKNSETDKHIYY